MKLLALMFSMLLAISGQFAFAADADTDTDADGEVLDRTFYQGKQGEAMDALEKTAGKSADDVEVPDVPPPSAAE